MSLEHILLGMLRTPSSGYDLRREFATGAAHFWAAGLNQIYPTLQRMEEKQWLKSKEEQSEQGPPRRVYRRTAAGTRELRSWLASDPKMPAHRLAYIGQLVFLGQLDDLEESHRFVTELREGFVQSIAVFDAPFNDETDASALELMKHAFETDATALGNLEFHYMLSMQLGRESIQNKIAICDWMLEMIKRKQEATENA